MRIIEELLKLKNTNRLRATLTDEPATKVEQPGRDERKRPRAPRFERCGSPGNSKRSAAKPPSAGRNAG